MPSRKAAYYNILIVVAATLLILAGQGQSEGDTSIHEYMLTKESADDHYITEGLVDEQHANYGPNYAEDESDKLFAVQQTDEDILAIGQAFTGFEEILAKEQEVLSDEQDNEEMLHELVEQDDDQELAEVENNLEEKEKIIFDQVNKTSMLFSQVEEVDYQSLPDELDDNEVLVEEMGSRSYTNELDDYELLSMNSLLDKDQAGKDDEIVANKQGKKKMKGCDHSPDETKPDVSPCLALYSILKTEVV